jgi:hypothetical protein
MSTTAQKSNRPTDATATLPCPSCATPTVADKHCAECGAVASPSRPVVPPQRETVIDLTKPGEESLTEVLPSAGTPETASASGSAGHAVHPDVDPAHGHGDLLDELGGQADAHEHPVALGRRLPSRRLGVMAGVGAIALVLLLVAGLALTRYLGGGTTREALTASTRDFTAVVSAMTAATSAEEVAAAARTAPAAAERIDGQLRLLGRPDDAGSRAVADQLTAESQLLRALSGLAALSTEPMQTWGAAHKPLTDAMEREKATRGVFAAHEADRAAQLPDTAAMMTAVTSAVGTSLADTAVTQAGDLLKALGSASTTADLREAAGRAAAEQTAVSSVLPALSDQTGRPTLAAYSRALAALAGLASLDGDNTAAWGPARAELTAALGALSGAGAEGAALSTQSTTALAAVDALVTRAAGQIADWKAAHEAAIADRNSDAAAMTAYVDNVRAEVKGYELLRNDLQAFFNRVEDPNVTVYYFEAYSELYQAEESRREVRDRLASMSVSEGMRAEHNALVAVLTRAIAAVQAGYDGVSQADDCYDYCYYRDTPGYARFQTESDGITKAYASAVKDWESTSGAVTASIKNRELPAKPTV